MITQAMLTFLHWTASLLVSGLAAMIPSPPSFWSDATTYLTYLTGSAAGPLLWFLPIGPSIAVAGVLLTLVLVAAALKLARMVFSVFTLGGGGVG